ncbi:MAG: D-ribose pyranase [Bacilli bacterium]|nr:D-ribose pyranase [Bacilli bacterium]MDD4547385.1 D-ribose pyranase [Bacilli bacterium]
MKKLGILNSDISTLLSHLGHTDLIVIGDCGLPIPDDVLKIDISLKLGSPAFIDVLEEVLKDMKVEGVILASEIITQNNALLDETIKILEGEQIKDIKYVSHEDFKKKTKEVKAVIRTGENTPYANIILRSGVIF